MGFIHVHYSLLVQQNVGVQTLMGNSAMESMSVDPPLLQLMWMELTTQSESRLGLITRAQFSAMERSNAGGTTCPNKVDELA
jgi:hypothetical protein